MGRPGGKKGPAASITETKQEPEGESQEQQPQKLNLYDQATLKATLDDTAKFAVLDAGYEENNTPSNVKIVAGTIAIALALYAQFGPGKFPANWWSVAFCVVTYTIISVALHFYSLAFEGDAFTLCLPRRGQAAGLKLSSHMERYSDRYSMSFTTYRLQPSHPAYRQVTYTGSVTSFFHSDGYFSESAFRPVCEKLLEQYEAALGQTKEAWAATQPAGTPGANLGSKAKTL